MALNPTNIVADPWVPCKQCVITNVDEDGENQYSGVNDDKYLECDKCTELIHPSCDNIEPEIAEKIDIYFCGKCRSRLRKIKYKNDKTSPKGQIVLAPPKLAVHYTKNEATMINPENPRSTRQKTSNISKNKPKRKSEKNSHANGKR